MNQPKNQLSPRWVEVNNGITAEGPLGSTRAVRSTVPGQNSLGMASSNTHTNQPRHCWDRGIHTAPLKSHCVTSLFGPKGDSNASTACAATGEKREQPCGGEGAASPGAQPAPLRGLRLGQGRGGWRRPLRRTGGWCPNLRVDFSAVSPDPSSRSSAQTWAAPRHREGFPRGCGGEEPVKRPGGVAPAGSTLRTDPPCPLTGQGRPGSPGGAREQVAGQHRGAGRPPSAPPEQGAPYPPAAGEAVRGSATDTAPPQPHRRRHLSPQRCRGWADADLCACSVAGASVRPGAGGGGPPRRSPGRKGAAVSPA